MSRRCCCQPRNCQYFNDAFDGEESGIDENDWVDCSSGETWEEDGSDLNEPGNGSVSNPAICMCLTDHPTGSFTVNLYGFFDFRNIVGASPGLIFGATVGQDGCPSGYCYVRFEYLGATLYNGTMVYAKVVFGTSGGGDEYETYLEYDIGLGPTEFNIIVDPDVSGHSQVTVILDDRTGDIPTMCIGSTSGSFCGVANFSAEEVHFSQFALYETCETNQTCLGNHCNLDGYCVPNELTATITGISCDTQPDVCPGPCPNPDKCQDDIGKSFTLTKVQLHTGETDPIPLRYDWIGSVAISAAGGELVEFVLECYGSISDLGCSDLTDDCYEYRVTGSSGTAEGNIESCTNGPAYWVVNGVDAIAGAPCCITVDLIITE